MTTTTTSVDELLDALLAEIRALVPDAKLQPNKSKTYSRLLLGTKAFAYVFPTTRKGVPIKIPKQLLGIEKDLPKGIKFKKGNWGLTATLTEQKQVKPAALAFQVAASAVEKVETKSGKIVSAKPEPVEALPTKVADPVDDGPAVTPNTVVVKIDGKKVKPDPKPSAKRSKVKAGK